MTLFKLGKASRTEKLFWGLGIVIVLIAFSVGFQYYYYNASLRIVNLNSARYRIIKEADGLLVSLADMERTLQGYAFSQDGSYIEAYNKSGAEFQARYDRLRQVCHDGDGRHGDLQRGRIEQVAELKQQWDENAAAVFSLPAAAMAQAEAKREMALRQDQSKLTSARMRALITDFINEEESLVILRSNEFEQAKGREGVALAGAAVWLLLLFAILIYRDYQERVRLQQRVRGLKSKLAQKVLRRTIKLQDANSALEDEISDRKKAQEALRELTGELERRVEERTKALQKAKQQTEDILNNISDGFFALDENLCFIYVNNEALRITNFSREQLLGRSILDVFADYELDEKQAAFVRALIERKPKHGEYRGFITGRLFEAHVYTGEGGATVYLRDITLEKENEAKIRKQAEMLDLAHDHITSFDLNGKISFWNRGAEKDFGILRAEAIGKNIFALLEIEYLWSVGDIRRELLEAGYWTGEIAVSAADGRKIVMHCYWTLEKDSYGWPASVFAISHNITEQKIIEASLRRSEIKFQECIDKVSDHFTFFRAVHDEAGRIVDFIYEFVNEAKCKAFGLPRDYFIGKRLLEMWPETIDEVFREYCQVYETGQPIYDELWYYSEVVEAFPEGYYQRQAIRIEDGVAVSVRNITEQKLYEQRLQFWNAELESKVGERTRELEDLNAALKEEIAERLSIQAALLESRDRLVLSESRYRGLIEHMQNALVYFKAVIGEDGKVTDLEYVDVNPAFEELCGLRAADLVGRRVSGLHRQEFFELTHLIGMVALTSQPVDFAYNFTLNGKWYQIWAYCPAEGFVAVIMNDITEIKMAENALRESGELYEALIHQSSEAITLIDYATKHVVEVNEAYCRMFGYKAHEAVDMEVTRLGLLNAAELADMDAALSQARSWSAKIRQYKRKDGLMIFAARIASLIHHRGKQLIMLSYRDITEQQKLQSIIQSQVEVAGAVQKSLLVPDCDDQRIVIRTIFQPLTLVSGDFYGYRWSPDGTRLLGYIIDITGHGIATALYTSAISSMLNEIMNQEEAWPDKVLKQLNGRLEEYTQHNIFAALLTFALDLRKRQISFSAGGINYVLVSTGQKTGLIKIPGIYLGVTDIPEFGTVTLPVQYGDMFYFFTDGLSDRLKPALIDQAADFEKMVSTLRGLAEQPCIQDDCSAVCLKITGIKKYPQVFVLAGLDERRRLEGRISHVLAEIAGEEYSAIEIALKEAVNNAVPRYNNEIRIKVNVFGSRLVLRVRHDGDGFDGNGKVREIRAKGVSAVFAYLMENDQERGRGIPIMLSLADRVVYNRSGQEVLLVKKLRPFARG